MSARERMQSLGFAASPLKAAKQNKTLEDSDHMKKRS
jgi:hypothetical protein